LQETNNNAPFLLASELLDWAVRFGLEPVIVFMGYCQGGVSPGEGEGQHCRPKELSSKSQF
jgi:hypothetical protein